MKLLIVRHAKSSWKDPDLSDVERPLNSRGNRDAPRMGERLKKRGAVPDCVISSPARRARKTAGHIAKAIGFPKKQIVLDEGIYMAGADTLFEMIQNFANKCKTVMIVGHNPGFTDLVNSLSDFRLDNMPTCAVAAFHFDVEEWAQVRAGSGTLEFFDYPKKFGLL